MVVALLLALALALLLTTGVTRGLGLGGVVGGARRRGRIGARRGGLSTLGSCVVADSVGSGASGVSADSLDAGDTVRSVGDTLGRCPDA